MKITRYALVAVGLIVAFAARPCSADTSYSFNDTLVSPVAGSTSVTGTFAINPLTGSFDTFDFTNGSIMYNSSNSYVLVTENDTNNRVEQEEVFTTGSCDTSVLGSTCGSLNFTFEYTTDLATGLFLLNADGFEASGACSGTVTSVTNGGGAPCDNFAGPGVTIVTSAYTLQGAVQQITTPTPEPSSLFLLGTGLIGGIGWTRRRFPK